MKNWFEEKNSEVARTHKKTYEKSLKCNHAVRLFEGEYYYKGFNISKDGGKEYPWNYGSPSELEHGSARTKKEAMQNIDYYFEALGTKKA